MNEINCKMIELARNVRGVTQKELSKSLEVTQSTLSKMERGEFNTALPTIIKIANTLNFPLEFFYQVELRTPISNIYFRKRSAISQRILDQIMGDVKIVLKCIDYLLEEIEITEYPKYKFDLTEGWTPGKYSYKNERDIKNTIGCCTRTNKIFRRIRNNYFFL